LFVVREDTTRSPARWILFPPPRAESARRQFAPFRTAAPDGLLIGSAYNDGRVWGLKSPAAEEIYERVLADNFNVLTAENACKPASIMPNASGPPDFAGCDRVTAFARANDMRFRLHVLGWGEWNPPWMDALPAAERRAAVLDYAELVLTRYGTRAAFVDVINEAVCDEVAFTATKRNCGSGPAHLKAGTWVPAIDDYLDALFSRARALAPSAVLVYNEYGAESDADYVDPLKVERVLATVGAARARGVPIDAVGFQFHVSGMHSGLGLVGSVAFSGWLQGVRRTFARFEQLGVQVHVTEIDGAPPAARPTRAQRLLRARAHMVAHGLR
jgi:GH35 family endo-1,4-beta-xylanase